MMGFPQGQVLKFPQIALRMENTRVPLPAMVDLLLSASPLRVEN